jgi:hypothetical protein
MTINKTDLAAIAALLVGLGALVTPTFTDGLAQLVGHDWASRIDGILAFSGIAGSQLFRISGAPSASGSSGGAVATTPTTPPDSGAAAGASSVNLLQELGLVEAALGDVAAFAAGQPVSGTAKIGNTDYTASVVVLPNGPAAPYQSITGSVLSIIGVVLGDVAAFSAGAPVAIAIKENKTWYGLTLSEATNQTNSQVA